MPALAALRPELVSGAAELRRGLVAEPPLPRDPVPVPPRAELAEHREHADLHAAAHELVRRYVLSAHERIEVRAWIRDRRDHAHHVLGRDLALDVLPVPAAHGIDVLHQALRVNP